MKDHKQETMTQSYSSYCDAVLYNRAMSGARHEEAHLFTMDITFEAALKKMYNGKKYITPAGMAGLLDCDMFELMDVVEQHKRSIDTKLLRVGNYGNCNYEVHASDKVYLQGWINFLSLPCYSDSREVKRALELLKAEMEKEA